MQNRTPVPRAARPALPDFAPVPRKYRHDGWTPERQRAFVDALADTGSVTRAAGMVNMAQANAYALRRAPGAEAFRRAWDAALDFGVQRLKDIAFERAIEGELIPVFVAGKLMGFRRKHNDRLLMFMLRHYGQDGAGDGGGKRTTISYVRASAGGEGASAEVGAATVRTVVTGRAGADGEARALRDDRLAGEVAGFGGVTLDAEAEAAINAALEDCAARARGAEAANDAAEPFVPLDERSYPFRGVLEPATEVTAFEPFAADEPDWRLAGADDPRAAIEAAVASVKRAKRRSNWGRAAEGVATPDPA